MRLTKSKALRPALSSVKMRLRSCSLPARRSSLLTKGYFCSKRLKSTLLSLMFRVAYQTTLPSFLAPSMRLAGPAGCGEASRPRDKFDDKHQQEPAIKQPTSFLHCSMLLVRFLRFSRTDLTRSHPRRLGKSSITWGQRRHLFSSAPYSFTVFS